MDDQQKKEVKALGRRLQSDWYILESDRKRSEQKRDEALAKINTMKRELSRLTSALEEEEVAHALHEREIISINTEMAYLRKKMNAL